MTAPAHASDLRRWLKLGLMGVLILALVSLPFVLWGEDFALPILERHADKTWALVAIAVALLSADSVAPVPSVIVIVGLAAKAGWVAGVVGGTVGLTGQVFFAAWFGRAAVGRIVPSFFSDAEVQRLRDGLHRKLILTLACLRSVPVLAEGSVMLAASFGVPVGRIVAVTIVPNVAISAIYALAAGDSFGAAVTAFFATVVPSYFLWRWSTRRRAARQ